MNFKGRHTAKELGFPYLAEFFFILFALSAFSAIASDNAREQDYAAILQQNPTLGNIVWLKAEGQNFLSLYIDAEKGNNANVAIILHDMAAYPDQKTVVYELRTQLPLHHWATLALQMPIREWAATESDYYPLFAEAKGRILAAIDYLQKKDAKNIAIIGYGLGALMSVYAVSENADNIAALATISLAAPETKALQVQTNEFIKKISLPFLDIYAEFDLPEVVGTAKQRRLAGKDNPLFRQERIDGENHAFQQDHERLVKQVYAWLTTSVHHE